MKFVAHILCVRPDGLLAIVEVESSASQFNEAGILPNELLDAFRETCFAGITWLAAAKATASIDSLPAPFGFWRNFGRRYFSAVCREYAQAHKVWRTPHTPDDESLNELLQSAPPMRGQPERKSRLASPQASDEKALWALREDDSSRCPRRKKVGSPISRVLCVA